LTIDTLIQDANQNGGGIEAMKNHMNNLTSDMTNLTTVEIPEVIHEGSAEVIS